jgi:hypothetical protein
MLNFADKFVRFSGIAFIAYAVFIYYEPPKEIIKPEDYIERNLPKIRFYDWFKNYKNYKDDDTKK